MGFSKHMQGPVWEFRLQELAEFPAAVIYDAADV